MSLSSAEPSLCTLLAYLLALTFRSSGSRLRASAALVCVHNAEHGRGICFFPKF